MSDRQADQTLGDLPIGTVVELPNGVETVEIIGHVDRDILLKPAKVAACFYLDRTRAVFAHNGHLRLRVW
jgi:hypothetical protein